MKNLPTIPAHKLGFSGFGRGDKTHTIGYLNERLGPPRAAFIQTDDDGVTLGFYLGLTEQEMDSTDLDSFRQYAINPSPLIYDDDVLQLLGLLESVNVFVQGNHFTAAHIDRQLIKHYNAVRIA